MTTPFQRARSAENKQERARALVEAARSLAIERGVASVTLTAVAERAGVHHSAVRRYFDSHRDVLLQLAREGWDRWADTVVQALGPPVTATELAAVLVDALAADPLFCDLLANVPLHLEHDVEVQRVIEFKRSSSAAIARMSTAISASAAGFDERRGLDVVVAASAMAATLWQAAHPAPPLAAAIEANAALAYVGPGDFEATLVRLLAATCVGLAR